MDAISNINIPMVWIFSILAAEYIANRKGVPTAGYVLGLFLGPLSILILLVAKSRVVNDETAEEPPENTSEITYSSGTGFAVSDDGHIITNHHVINGAKRVYVILGGERVVCLVLGYDALNDLALLQAKSDKWPSVALFRQASATLIGETCTVAGFPLGGNFSSTLTVTTGIVSSVVGIGDDSNGLQVTAPIHGGNSGGPLLDSSGLVIGVVRAIANPHTFIARYGQLPQNIGFAIKAEVLKSFLSIHNVKYLESRPTPNPVSFTEIAQDASEYVFKLECTNKK